MKLIQYFLWLIYTYWNHTVVNQGGIFEYIQKEIQKTMFTVVLFVTESLKEQCVSLLKLGYKLQPKYLSCNIVNIRFKPNCYFFALIFLHETQRYFSHPFSIKFFLNTYKEFLGIIFGNLIVLENTQKVSKAHI